MNRIEGAALAGLVAGVLVASAIGSVTRRRPHTVIGAILGLIVGGALEGVWMLLVVLWPLLLVAGVLVLAGMVGLAWSTINPGGQLPPEIPDDYERVNPWDT